MGLEGGGSFSVEPIDKTEKKQAVDFKKSPEFECTTKSQGDIQENLEYFIRYDSTDKFRQVAIEFHTQIDSSEERLLGTIHQMESQLGDRFNENMWIASTDKVLSNELSRLSRSVREMQDAQTEEALQSTQAYNLDLRLLAIEGQIAEMLLDQKEFVQNNHSNGLSEQEVENLYQQQTQLLYSPLSFVESLRITPEMEMQYKAHVVADRENKADIESPDKFNDFMVIDNLNSVNLQDHQYAVASMQRDLEDRRNNRSITSLDQRILDQLDASLWNLTSLFKDYLDFQNNELRDVTNREEAENKIKKAIEAEYTRILNQAKNSKVADLLQDLYGKAVERQNISIVLPDNLGDLIKLARENPQGKFGEGVNQVLARFVMDIKCSDEKEQAQIDLEPEYIAIYNTRKIISVYCLSSGETQGSLALEHIKSVLGDKFDDYINDPNLHISWNKDGSSIVLKSKSGQIEIPVLKKSAESIFEDQEISRDSTLLERQIEKVNRLRRKINEIPSNFQKAMLRMGLKEEDEKLQIYLSEWNKKYAGEYELVDNMIGRIEDLTIVENALRNSEILSILKSFKDKKINFVATPKIRRETAIKGEFTESQEEYEKRIINYLEENGIESPKERINFIYSHTVQAKWARDYFLQAKDAKTGNRVFIESPLQHIAIGRNVEMTRDVAQDNEMQAGTEYREMGVYFEGGDWRVVGPFLFVGEQTFERAIQASKQTMYEVSYVLPNGQISSQRNIQLHKITNKFVEEYISSISPEEYERLKAENENNEWQTKDAIREIIKKTWNYSKKKIFLIGEQEIDQDSITDEQAGELIKKEYHKLFGREVIIAGEGDQEKQAIFHIDMFLTFLPNLPNKPTVLVGDQSMTADLLARYSQAELDSIEKQMTQSQISAKEMREMQSHYQEAGREYDIAGDEGDRLIKHDIGGGLEQFVQEIRSNPQQLELQKKLDAVAKWFEDRGFEVKRIPSVVSTGKATEILNPESKEVRGTGESAKRNYNNGLFEVYMDKNGQLIKRFYMPTYGITPVEKRVMETYNQLGYEVIPVDSLITSARAEGVLNCITSEYRADFQEK